MWLWVVKTPKIRKYLHKTWFWALTQPTGLVSQKSLRIYPTTKSIFFHLDKYVLWYNILMRVTYGSYPESRGIEEGRWARNSQDLVPGWWNITSLQPPKLNSSVPLSSISCVPPQQHPIHFTNLSPPKPKESNNVTKDKRKIERERETL